MQQDALLAMLNARTGYDIWSWNENLQAFTTKPLCPHVVRLIEQDAPSLSRVCVQSTREDGSLEWSLSQAQATALLLQQPQRLRG